MLHSFVLQNNISTTFIELYIMFIKKEEKSDNVKKRENRLLQKNFSKFPFFSFSFHKQKYML